MLLAENAETTTSRAIGEMSQRLEHELEAVVSGTVMASVQNTQVAIEGLRIELQAKFNQDWAELQATYRLLFHPQIEATQHARCHAHTR